MTTTQTPSPTDAQIADVQAWLLGLPCPDCKGEGRIFVPYPAKVGPAGIAGHDCDTCNATGLRFSGLSRECPGYGSQHPPHLPGVCYTDGRVPAFTLEAVLEALPGGGTNGVLHNTWQFHFWNEWEVVLNDRRTYGKTVLEAATRALAAAVQAQEVRA